MRRESHSADARLAAVPVQFESRAEPTRTMAGKGAGTRQKFLPFKKALLCARALKLKSKSEWVVWCKSEARDAKIPSTPHKIYKHNGWQGYGHWLGTGNLVGGKLAFLPFKKALLYARTLKLKSVQEWRDWVKTGVRPANIPSSPHRTYTLDGWQGYGHWLGTGNLVGGKLAFLPFKKALLHARSLKLKSHTEWKYWAKTGVRPANMPSTPDKHYKHDGWQGWGHWLGTGNLVGGKLAFLPFDKALVYARSLKLKNQKDWKDWAKTGVRPANIPFRPDQTYKHDGWQGYGHWLGTGNLVGGRKLAFLPFKKALLFARSLKLTCNTEWLAWCNSGKRPANIPATPEQVYKHNGWQGYGHWLGTGNVAPRDKQLLPFKKALVYARTLKLKGCKEWEAWCKSGARPKNVPSNPQQTYKHDGWQGYGHWLGTGNVRGGNGQQ